ncbi:MAG: hypothetical protein ABS894_00785 [Aerococcus urinaeequi]
MNETFKKNYIFSLEQQIQKEERRRKEVDGKMNHYANKGNAELMHHFDAERSSCEGAINALNLALHLFKMGMGVGV